MDQKEYELQLKSLENMGIHTLRTFARECGVKAPTTLKKEELIDLIMKIKKGEIEPVISKMGRKPKTLPDFSFATSSNMDSGFLSLHSPTILSSNTPCQVLECQVKFNELNNPIFRLIEKTGRVVDIPVLPSLLTKHNLKKDDLVTAEMKTSPDGYSYIIGDIITINGIDATKYHSDLFYNLDNVPNLIDYLRIENFEKHEAIMYQPKILKGKSCFYYYKDGKNLANYITDFANDIKEDKLHIVILNASHTPTPNIKDTTIYNIDYNKSYEEIFKDIIVAREHVKNLFISNQKVLFIISEIDELFKIINYNITNTISDDVAPDSLTEVRKLVNLSKYISKQQNLSVVTFSSFATGKNYRDILVSNIIQYLYEVKLERK
ncbi:MAG: hypothetical protein E7361_01660 [Clostridiales bacterium]|nr:hypothetical protein [Clostridiales bacterium]